MDLKGNQKDATTFGVQILNNMHLGYLGPPVPTFLVGRVSLLKQTS